MLKNKKYIGIVFFLCCVSLLKAQIPQPIAQLLKAPYMRGASFSLAVKEVNSKELAYAYQPELAITPASVMKMVTTAAALELLGEDFRFATTLAYNGTLTNGTLHGDIYIQGSGDPTLGSRHLKPGTPDFLVAWRDALRAAGIQKITGAVIADAGCFDTEGVSFKWMAEDLGSYYGAGSYGISVFDNNYSLFLNTGVSGSVPSIVRTEPEMKNLTFHNYLTSKTVAKDSSLIVGFPFSTQRYLYGVVPAAREGYVLKGDIPDPALFLAEYFTDYLHANGIFVQEKGSSLRLLTEQGKSVDIPHANLFTTYSPTLKEIVRITNEVSQNLYADALIKTIGQTSSTSSTEVLSSFGKGVAMVSHHWQLKGLDISSLWMNDGSGLAPVNKLSARFVVDLLSYMGTSSEASAAFHESLPLAGSEGSVRNFLKGTSLQGKARLKSGSMTRVKGYAGYVDKDGKRYAIALFINNYTCEGREITRAIEQLLTALL